MLYADKRALETNLKVNLLAIREKELNYYSQNCLAVGTQAALLAGFAYSGLTQVAIPLDSECKPACQLLAADAHAVGSHGMAPALVCARAQTSSSSCTCSSLPRPCASSSSP